MKTVEELIHYGVKGMRWGVRREHVGVLSSTSKLSSSLSDVAGIKSTSKSKGMAKYMTDDELRARVNRLNMEKQYDKLTTEEISAGRQKAKNTLATIGTILSAAAAVAGVAVAVQDLRRGSSR